MQHTIKPSSQTFKTYTKANINKNPKTKILNHLIHTAVNINYVTTILKLKNNQTTKLQLNPLPKILFKQTRKK